MGLMIIAPFGGSAPPGAPGIFFGGVPPAGGGICSVPGAAEVPTAPPQLLQVLHVSQQLLRVNRRPQKALKRPHVSVWQPQPVLQLGVAQPQVGAAQLKQLTGRAWQTGAGAAQVSQPHPECPKRERRWPIKL
jgi:hypothetical protein